MWIKSETVTVTTPVGSGDKTEYSSVIRGLLLGIIYTKTDYDAGVDFSITGETTGQEIWVQDNVDASVSKGPAHVAHASGGGAIAGACRPVGIPNERIAFAITNAGNAHSGTFTIIWC